VAVLAGAALMTAADLLIDPVATRVLHFWTWHQPGIFYGVPLVNFAGWFAVSGMLLALAGKPRRASGTAPLVGLSVLLFFAIAAVAR
jgi:putative membrane protein